MSFLPAFSSPLWLLISLPTIAFLAFVYFRSTQGKQKLVGSTFLLQHISRKPLQRSTFLPPLRFFLECGLVLLLSLALAGMFWNGGAQQHYLLVLDDSLSTSAIAPGSVLERSASVFDKLKKNLMDFAEAQGTGSRFTLALGSSCGTVSRGGAEETYTLKETSSLSELDKRVMGLTPQFTHVQVEHCATKLMRSGRFTRARIFTDREASEDTVSDTSLALTLQSAPLHPQERFNIALSNFQISHGKNGIFDVSLESFAPTNFTGEIEGELVLYGLHQDGSDSLEHFILARKKIKIPPGEKLTAQLSTNESYPIYAVRLVTQNPNVNRISKDDITFLIGDDHLGEVQVVSLRSLSELGLSSDLPYSFLHKTPAHYEKEPAKKNRIALNIFDTYVPGALPSSNVLLIAPPRNNKLLPVGPLVRNPRITFAAAAHPITKYVRFADFTPRAARALLPEPWAQDILRSDTALLLFAGESGGRRIAVSGFELFPYQGKQALQRGLLFLNLLHWLTQRTLVATGKPSERAEEQGKFIQQEADGFTLRARQPDQVFGEPGIFLGQGSFQKKNVFAFYEAESGMQEPPIVLNETLKREQKSSDTPSALLRILLTIAILCYLSYWLLRPFFSRLLPLQHAKKIAPQSKGGV